MNIERRRRWIDLIWREIARTTAHKMSTTVIVNGVCHPSTATIVAKQRIKRLLALLRRVRRCPECGGIGFTWEDGEKCPTCGGTGRL